METESDVDPAEEEAAIEAEEEEVPEIEVPETEGTDWAPQVLHLWRTIHHRVKKSRMALSQVIQ